MAAGELYLQALFQSDQRLRRFLLPNVCPTGRKLGTGGYGAVEEVEVDGLVCASKKIHDAILQERNITKFVEECQLMSDLRHPHLVQFLGICFLPPSPLPVLVMEKLHSSLDGLLTQHTRHPPLLTAADIPLGLKRSFFVDTARGLRFLHHHSPSPIIHRDLSAGNVLLTPSMVAKISDFGNARMMDLRPDQLARLTRVPGTPVYMPPEAHLTPPCYGPALDIFSLGHLMLYTLIQVFPWDLLADTYPDPHAPRRRRSERRRVIVRPELERREHYITQLHQQLGAGHPLVQLVEECLADEAEVRPSTEEVLQRLEQMEIDDPYQNLTRLEMMRMVGQKEEEIRQTVEESRQKDREIQRRGEELRQMEAEMGWKEQTIQQKEEEIQRMGEGIQQRDVELGRKEDELRQKEGEKQSLQSHVNRLETHVRELEAVRRRDAARVESLRNQVHELESEKERTQAQHTSEVETLSQRISALSEDNSALSSLVEAKTRSLAAKEERIEALRRELVVKERQVEDKGKEVEAKQQQIDSVTRQTQAHVELVHSFQDQLSALQQQTEGVAQERDALQLEVVSLREGLQTKDAEIAVQRERVCTTEEEVRAKAAETTAKDALLQSKERMVQSLWREVESLKQKRPEQVSILHPGGASLKEKQRAPLPARQLRRATTQESASVKFKQAGSSGKVMEKITGGEYGRLIERFEDLTTSPDGLLGELEEVMEGPFEAKRMVSNVFKLAHSQSRKAVIEALKTQLEYLFVLNKNAPMEEMEDASRGYGRLLHASGLKANQAAHVAALTEQIRGAIESSKYRSTFQPIFQKQPSILDEMVELAWEMIVLPNPMVISEPDTIAEQTHEREYGYWDASNPGAKLIYLRPVIYRSYQGDLACKAWVANSETKVPFQPPNSSPDQNPQARAGEGSDFVKSALGLLGWK